MSAPQGTPSESPHTVSRVPPSAVREGIPPHAAVSLAPNVEPLASGRHPTPVMTWVRRVLWAVLAVSVVLGGIRVVAMRALGPEVTVVHAARHEVVRTVVSSGRVLSPGEVNLGSMVGGIVREVRVREGDRVRAGAVLVTFDTQELDAQVAQARAGVLVAAARVGQLRAVSARVAVESVQQAESNLRAAQATWTRQQALFREGAIAATELEAAQRAVEVARSQRLAAEITAAGAGHGGGDARVAEATRAQAEAALRVAEARLAQAQIVASVDGVIVRRSVEPGDVVSPARTLLVLLRDGPMELSVTPDERNLADLALGQSAVASAEAFAGDPFGAVVSYLAPAVDALRGTIEVKLRVPSPPAYLRAAMTVSVEIEVARRAGVLTLPIEAVRDVASPHPWALAVDPDGHARRHALTLGLRGTRVVEVTAGLAEGARVLAADVTNVRDGQRVRVLGTGAR